jgi:hypothetical protein
MSAARVFGASERYKNTWADWNGHVPFGGFGIACEAGHHRSAGPIVFCPMSLFCRTRLCGEETVGGLKNSDAHNDRTALDNSPSPTVVRSLSKSRNANRKAC